jgi:predicted TIM-barrel fold metal-dependent hydrolase
MPGRSWEAKVSEAPERSNHERPQEWHGDAPIDAGWLAQHVETAIEPALPIVDAHHHLWQHAGHRYLEPELLSDLRSGHDVRATVYIEASSFCRTDGAEALRPVGETEYVRAVADGFADGRHGTLRACAGIVAFARLQQGAGVAEVLEAHLAAGGGHVRGIRNVSTWHEVDALKSVRSNPPAGLLGDAGFRAGFACLAPLHLSFDAWLYHTQLDELFDLARAFPDTRIVIDHLGGPIGAAPCEGRRAEAFADWRAKLQRLAACPNVHMKLGGLGMRWAGFDFHRRPVPPSSEDLAAAWKPYIETAIELFTPDRCMFESNFPVDNEICSYVTLWNAFKRVTASYAAGERAALFGDTARAFYRLP